MVNGNSRPARNLRYKNQRRHRPPRRATVIEMRDVQPQPHLRRQATQQMQQAEGVRPARYGHDQRHAVAQQVISAGRALHLNKQIGHDGMIACGRARSKSGRPAEFSMYGCLR